MSYYGSESDGVHLPFNFQLVESDWQAEAIARFILDYEAALPAPGWPNWVTGTNDARRMASPVGGAQARVTAMLLLMLRVTPTLYTGDLKRASSGRRVSRRVDMGGSRIIKKKNRVTIS